MTEASPSSTFIPAASIADVTVADSAARRIAPWWIWIACVIVALIAVQPALHGDAFIGSDDALVQHNSFLLRIQGVAALWTGIVTPSVYPLPQYSPLAQTVFFAEHLVWGDRVWGYRLDSALLHATVGLLIYQLLSRLRIRGAAIAAVLFAAHPVTMESVAWLTERRNVLGALLGLSSTYLLLRASGTIDPPPDDVTFRPLPPEPNRLYALAGVMQVLALFASPSVALLPGVALLVAWWRGRSRLGTAFVAVAAGLMVAGFAMALVNAKVERSAIAVTAGEWQRDDNTLGDAVTRTQLAGRGVLTYAARFVAPYPISIDQPRALTPNDIARISHRGGSPLTMGGPAVGPEVALAWFAPILVVGFFFGAWKTRARFGLGPIVTGGAFVLLLAPSSNFITLGWMRDSFVADRAAYLAVAPLMAGVVAGVIALARTRGLVNAAWAVGGLALIAMLAVSRTAAARFADELAFWHATLTANPRSRLAVEQATYTELGQTAPDFEAIFKRLTDGLALYPIEPSLMCAQAKALARVDQPERAVETLRATIESEPGYAPAYAQSAEILRGLANAHPNEPLPRVMAQQAYRSAVALDPRNATARLWLAECNSVILRKIGIENPHSAELVEESAKALDEATQFQPFDVPTLTFAADQFLRIGRVSAASERLAVAQRLEPRNPEIYVLLGDAYAKANDDQHAESSLQQALQIDPTSTRALLRLAALRQSQERWDAANDSLASLLAMRPDSPEGKQRKIDVDAHRQTQWPPFATTQSTTQATTMPATTQGQ